MRRTLWIPVALYIIAIPALMVMRQESTQAVSQGTRTTPMSAEQPPAQPAKKYSLENCIREFSQDKAEKTERGWEFWFVPAELSPTFNFKMTQVGAQSANHPPHSHPEEEIYYIIEGKAEFSLNGQTKVVGANSTMFCPPNMPHGIRNIGDAPLRYAVIKANVPRP
jgi:quercetin dioxygenase-like cupin family protein